MLTLLDNLARRLVRRGLRRGILEGNMTWVAILAVALFVRLIARPQRPRIMSEKIRLGESITVTHTEPPARRRAARNAAREQ